MGGNTGEIQKGSERKLYKYVNHQAGTTKASTRINYISTDAQYIGVPDHSTTVSHVEKYIN